MRKTLLLVSFLALITTSLAADPAPEVEALDTANAPFAIASVNGDYAGDAKTLTIRTRLSTASDVPGALLRISAFTADGACRLKGAFRRDLTRGDREWQVTLRGIESGDRVFVSPDVTPAKNTAGESRRSYDDLLAKELDKRGMKPMASGCRLECRDFQLACSLSCADSGLGSCTDCYPLMGDSCSCMICQCKPSPVNCDDNPCL